MKKRPINLLETQRAIAAVVMRPLGPRDNTRRVWLDGRPVEDIVDPIIKGNDRLSGLECLEIYNRQYWYRVLECIGDDFPGVRTVLGEARFKRLVIDYLQKHPSRSYTLRNLGSSFPAFLEKHPEYAGARAALAAQLAAFEWAQVEAFDQASLPPLTPADLPALQKNLAGKRLRVQPHVQMLALDYPLDDFVLAAKRKNAAGATASNAVKGRKRLRRTAVRMPKRQQVWLVVHRYNELLYYKRLEREAFVALRALAAGQRVGEALQAALQDSSIKPEEIPTVVGGWFATWSKLGWLCRP